MAVIGFNLEKGGFRYSVLEGTKAHPKLIEKDRVIVNTLSDTSELMDWYETSFQNILTKFQVSKIGIRLALNGKKAEISSWYYPYGILHALAHKNNTAVSEYVSQNFTASKFNLDKGIDIYNHVDNIIGVHRPYWDKSQKYSVLAAWMVL